MPRGSWLAAAGVTLVLAVLGGRYGYHRDELYFISAGHHPAWGYPDQPPLVPLLAAGWDAVTQHHLWAFRLVPAVLTGVLVVVASLTSRAMGGTRAEQVGTAAAAAMTALFLGTGHLFSTTTFDIVATATTLLLLIRALEAPRERELLRWLPVGIAAGVTMEIKTLLAFAGVAVLAGLLAVGPRAPLRRPGPYVALVAAALVAAPNLWWQATNGWPQLEIGRSIAGGGSASSAERWLVVPLQFLMVGPVIGVVMVVGLVALWRRERWRPYRWIGVAYVVLLVLVIATGGKPYYSGGLMLPLLAAGVPWVLKGAAGRAGRAGIAVALTVHVIGSAIITLPVATPGSPLTKVAAGPNPDAAETVGWDRFVDHVLAQAPDDGRTVVVTRNYGEAGALDQARRAGTPRVPPVYSGHNAYGEWGPPPDQLTRAIFVGDFDTARLRTWFTTCTELPAFDNGYDLENEEQNASVQSCESRTRPWQELWPQVKHLN